MSDVVTSPKKLKGTVREREREKERERERERERAWGP